MIESENEKHTMDETLKTDDKHTNPSNAADSNKRLKLNPEPIASNKAYESIESSNESAAPESLNRRIQTISKTQPSSTSSNIVTQASPSFPVPTKTGLTKDIRLIKLSDKKWLCDVCKGAVFENFVEACMHEIACKSIKNARRNSSEASMNINMMAQLARRNSFTYGQSINSSGAGTLSSNGPVVFPTMTTAPSYNASLSRNNMNSLNGMMHQFNAITNPASGSVNQAVISTVTDNHLVSSTNPELKDKASTHDITDFASASSTSNLVTRPNSSHIVSKKTGVEKDNTIAEGVKQTLESTKNIELSSETLKASTSESSISGSSVTSYSSAKSREDSSDVSKEHYDGTQVDISLIPENKNLLSDYNYLLVKNIELFQVPTSFNASQIAGINPEELPATKVGLRCIHCSSNERQITASSFFPSSISSMASGIGTIGSRHMIGGKCPLLPKSVLHELKEAKLSSQQQSRIPGKVALDAYCKDIAKTHKIFDHEFGGIYVAINESIRKQMLVEACIAAKDAPANISHNMPKEQKIASDFDTNEIRSLSTRNADSNSNFVCHEVKDVAIDTSDTSAFIPGTIEHFWECKHCISLPFHWRASGSVLYSAGPLEMDYVKKHLEACQGKNPLRIPRDAKINLKNETVQVSWCGLRKGLKRKTSSNRRSATSTVDDAPKVSSSSDNTTLNINPGVEDGCLALPEDKIMTTDYAWFTVSQLKKCYLTKAGGSRGNCPVGYPGLACKFCSGTLNERRFFYTSADHLRNSFSHIPSHLLSCSETPPDVKEKIEELKSIRSKQKSQLKAGDHKEFIDNVWLRLHGPGGGHVEQKLEDGEKLKANLRRCDDGLDDVSIEFQSEGNDFHSMSIDGRFLETKEINTETSNCAFLFTGDRKMATDYVYYSLLQMTPIELCTDEDGRVTPYFRKTKTEKATGENFGVADDTQPFSLDRNEGSQSKHFNENNEAQITNSKYQDHSSESKLGESKEECDIGELENPIKVEENETRFTSIVCKHCNTNFDTNLPPFLPRSTEELRLSIFEIPKHLMSCDSCPDKVKTTLTLLRASRGVQEALLKKGSYDKFFKTIWSRIDGYGNYGKNLDEPVKSDTNESESDHDGYTVDVAGTELLQESDRSLVTEYTFYTMQQMDPVALESSGNGSRSMFQNGFPGLACKHCSGKPHARKFFYRTSEILSGNYAHIPNHVLSCKHAPMEVKKTLAEKKKDHQAQKSRLSRGSQRVFFNQIWDRLHSKKK